MQFEFHIFSLTVQRQKVSQETNKQTKLKKVSIPYSTEVRECEELKLG